MGLGSYWWLCFLLRGERQFKTRREKMRDGKEGKKVRDREKNKLIAIQRAQCKTRLAVWGHNQKNSKLLLSREVG